MSVITPTTDFATFNTDDISEGSTNLYHTNERVDDRVNGLLQAGANITLTYDDTANTLTIAATEDNLSNNDTDDLSEGSTNLYFTNARAVSAVLNTDHAGNQELAADGNLVLTASADESPRGDGADYLYLQARQSFIGINGVGFQFDTVTGTPNTSKISTYGSTEIEIDEKLKVDGHLEVTGAQIDFTALPTSDPGVVGRLYRDGATVKVSI